ncbi:uncharacterized protein LOC120681921 isoform X2 [Panicum virgatum]|uniref:uncharacterized protein LOC120681921 isoform X2 n=1 Tax=Panicum virgatum TaxID=38727 RepID=UPI0019D59CFA|nr:uncharacterized protein LOC120681921 isoform X2 [Panicum virgatum]
MAEAAGGLDPAQGPEEAPLDAARRVEQLSLKRRRRGEEEAEAAVADAEVALGLESAYQVAQEGMVLDVLDSSTAAISIDDLDAYLERLRKEVALAKEGNRKVSDEIGVIAETTANDMIQLDVDIEVLESLLSKLESEGFNHFEASPVLGQSDSTDSCINQSIADKDCIYEVLEVDHQIARSKMNLKMLQNLQSVDEMWQLRSMLLRFGATVLDFKDNCLRMFLKAPTWTSDCVIYGQKLNCAIDSFISDHELLIEVDEGNMEPKNLKIFPDDVCVDILIERLESSRHSFEYFDKEDVIIAHLDRGIDASIKISSDWPLCSYGLKLISICNSGTHPTNIASSLLSKTKELGNGLDQHIRQHLVRFVDAVEEILIRQLRSG